jgi:glucosamine--fructose-6-phosphate aminotransferase (isomerizing)
MSRMLEEIRQQPAVLARTLSQGVRAANAFRKVLERRRPRIIVLVARGTSDNAAIFGRYLLEITTGIPVSLAAPSILTLYGARVDYKDALVVALSQSGESTDTNFLVERAREQGALTLGITNTASSSLAKSAEHVFLVRAGKEKSVAATKTYTGQMLLLYLLAHALDGAVHLAELERLPGLVESALGLETEIAELAGRYRFMHHTVVVGRGLNYANAFEFALKLMETTYVVAERFSSADFMHGPIALVEPGFPVFAFVPSGATAKTMAETLAKLHSLKAEVVVISDAANSGAIDAPRVVRVPKKMSEVLTPIPYIVPAQLFTASLAAHKGLDPDRPRTLSKVTRTL